MKIEEKDQESFLRFLLELNTLPLACDSTTIIEVANKIFNNHIKPLRDIVDAQGKDLTKALNESESLKKKLQESIELGTKLLHDLSVNSSNRIPVIEENVRNFNKAKIDLEKLGK